MGAAGDEDEGGAEEVAGDGEGGAAASPLGPHEEGVPRRLPQHPRQPQGVLCSRRGGGFESGGRRGW